MQSKLKSMFGSQDMTVGNTMKAIVAFSWPLLIGNLAQQLYNTVDSVVVGKYVGDSALAAVGLSGSVMNLMFVLFVGISTGATILVSQFFGARDRDRLSKAIGNTLTMTLLISIFMAAVGSSISVPVLKLLNTPDDVLPLARDYLITITLGCIGLTYYNMIAGILRGLGDALTPVLYLIVACLLNIGLDILFVAQFNMACFGVALATVIAQIVAAGFSMLRLMKMRDVFDLNKESLKLEKGLTGEILRLGMPSGLTQAIFALANIVVQSLINSFGTVIIACSVVVMRVDAFVMMPNFSFGTALTTFTGQNVGAGKLDRVHKGKRDGLILAFGVSLVMVLVILVFGKQLIRMFTDTEELIDISYQMLTVLATGYIAMAGMQILQGIMRGAGDTVSPMWISIISTIVLRMPIAYLWAYLTRSEAMPNGDPLSLFGSLLIAWIISLVITILVYRYGAWKKKAIANIRVRAPESAE